MPDRRVELAEMALPEFGLPGVAPVIPAATYEARVAAARRRAEEAGYDALLVYADREHFANLAYLTGFDPRFEEALLILTPGRAPVLLAGNENAAYTAISLLRLDVVLYQTFSLLGQPRSTSAPLATILRDAGVGGAGGPRVGIAGWKYFIPAEAEEPDLWSEAPAYLVDTLRGLGCEVRNAGCLFMEPEHGLRAVSDVDQLCSGMALQVDIIPTTGTPYFTTNIEDGIALADASLREEFERMYPDAWARIQQRRAFMRDALGVRLKPEVLPFSNIPAYLPPFWLSPGKAMRAV